MPQNENPTGKEASPINGIAPPETGQRIEQVLTDPNANPALSAEQLSLLEGFGLEALCDGSHVASYDIHSKDVEMGASERVWWGEEKIDHIPEVFRTMPEMKEIFNFLRKPSTDINQIKQRQSLITALSQFSDLNKAKELKNAGYNVYNGVKTLFAPISVSDYHKEAALYAYRNGHQGAASSVVTEGFQLIEYGKKAIDEFVVLLSTSTNPFILRIRDEFRKASEEIKFMTREYFLKEDYFEVEKMGNKFAGKTKDTLIKAGMFIEFSNLAKEDSYSCATFDEDQPRGYKKGWTFFRKKKADGERGNDRRRNGEKKSETQVLNNSPADHEVTVYAGSNMSGKSFSGLKKEFYMQCIAQCFGYAPCEGGANFPVIHDSFHYLDRASTKHSSNLSAFGNEVGDWKSTTPRMGNNPFVCIDEGWSTTSAEDQYKLLSAATVFYLPRKGAKVFTATHNERFIEEHADTPSMGIYHFKVEMPEDSDKPKYYYELTPGPDDSNALAVARGLGMQEEILQIAQGYLDGHYPPIGKIAIPQFKPIIPYTAEERADLKAKKIEGLIAGKKDGMLTVFSADESFRFGMSELSRGEDMMMGRWSPHNVEMRNSFLNRLILQCPRLEPPEALERQKTFAALAENDKFAEMLPVEDKLIYLFKFLTHLSPPCLLKFNLEINPFGRYNDRHYIDGGSYSNGDFELALAYLEMNKKLMGDAFPIQDKLDAIYAAKRDTDKMEDIIGVRPISSVRDRLRDEANEVITDDAILELFAALINKIPEPDQEGQATWNPVLTISQAGKYLPVTRERIRQYLAWISHEHYSVEWDDKRFRKLRSMAFDEYDSGSIDDVEEEFTQGCALFWQTAHEFGEDEPEKWGDLITLNRIKALKNRLRRMTNECEHHGERYSKLFNTAQEIGNVEWHIRRKQDELGISEEEWGGELEGRTTPDMLKEKLTSCLEICNKAEKYLPPLRLFDYDLTPVMDEINTLVAYYKKNNRRSDIEYHGWDSTLSFILLLDILADKRDYPSELVGALKSYDSVHTHQLANNLIECFGDYAQEGNYNHRRHHHDRYFEDKMDESQKLKDIQGKWKRSRKSLVTLCGEGQARVIDADLDRGDRASYDALVARVSVGSGPHMLSMYKDVYNNTVAEFNDKVTALERRSAELSNKYPKVKRRLGYSGGRKNLRIIAKCGDPQYRTSLSTERIRKLIAAFFEYKIHGHEEQWKAREEFTDKIDSGDMSAHEVFNEFWKQNLEGTQDLADITAFFKRLRAMGYECKSLAEAENIYKGIRESTAESWKSMLKEGDPYPLRKALDAKYSHAMRNVVDYEHDRDGRIYSNIARAMGLFFMGHKIKSQGFTPVEFNSTGEIALPENWSIFEDQEGQVRNDVILDAQRRIKLLGSSNMSGKTYWEKGGVGSFLYGMATGHAPCAAGGTMPVLDDVIYFDRVTTRTDIDLSSFGEEIKRAMKWLETAQPGRVTVTMADEFGSSTSPKYQDALYYAMAVKMIESGQYAGFASHCHDATDRLEKVHGDHLDVSHFAHHKEQTEEGERIIFDHKMTSEREDSEAIDVAETLGLDPEIIAFARML